MLLNVLSVIHNATTLFFGVYVSAAFLGVRMKRKNIISLLLFSVTVGIFYVLSYLLFGVDGTEKIYPFIIHLPLAIFLSLRFGYRPAPSALSVLTGYLCCQISNWAGLAALNITDSEEIYYGVRIAVTTFVFVILIRYISDATAALLQKPTKAILILGLMPFVYYLFDYVTGVYTSLLYSGVEGVVEFLGFMLCIFYLLFISLYFKQYEEKLEAEQKNRLMELKRQQYEKELCAIRRSERDISILRHDMRHYLLNLSAYIKSGEDTKAEEYIESLITAADQTATRKYCKNEIVNIIVSSHMETIEREQIDFSYAIDIPDKLPFSDVDITAILSNALENAIRAVSELPTENRIIRLDLRMNGGKLLLSLKNRFAQKPTIIDGLPTSASPGHGFGTQSIRYMAEKLNGNCRFSVNGEWFVLQVIL